MRCFNAVILRVMGMVRGKHPPMHSLLFSFWNCPFLFPKPPVCPSASARFPRMDWSHCNQRKTSCESVQAGCRREEARSCG